ncbi:MAG: acyl-ACP thioesterase [Anaerophaga sp.]|uniref:acyl-[acyl-carrier-protein] thioesterase n=1 Tax=Anaerophaga thermohalophila TaxID=177400 RepID=UPI000237CDB1|nr:acyl-ACP thioesterase domain-containing protein [Anaerophaga thermohalophila]MBZ4676503.1 acyl-ACP thioesterase [Anaerophaga sp.]MDK2843047.1 hypothetical protein [Anaerophaga sp.]
MVHNIPVNEELKKIHEEKLVISSFDVGASGHLETPALMRHLQEAAARHAIALGVGFEDFIKENIFWALTHLQVEVNRWPKMNENVTVETWPRNIQKLYTTRDYLLKDTQNNILIRGTSAWIMVDIKRKRPVRPNERLQFMPFLPELKALGEFPEYISTKPENKLTEHRHEVVYSDLDINRHVNNTRYMEWVMDAIATIREQEIASFNIHFTSEFRKGETGIIKIGNSQQMKGSIIFNIEHAESAKTGCSGMVKFI